MSSELQRNPGLEIAHVLFMDVVGYSKLLINQQSDLLQQLNRIVRSTEQFRRAEAAGKLVRLPTGDGMALAFFTSPDAPVRCAREISAAVRGQPDLRLRMGIHSGPVDAVPDVNDRTNVAGAGINMAQRVMDCGDAGHILLSQRVADDLNQYAEWQAYLHELGEFEVKHGARISIVNLFGDGVGNPAVPEKLRRLTRLRTTGLRRRRIAWAFVSLFVIGALALGFWFQGLRVSRTDSRGSGIPEKSIAVLPFENLSVEKDDAFFADGIQDDVLASLGKIKDLKVIARSSVMIYRGAAVAGKLREIGQALRVSHLLQGSVRRSTTRVVINVALVDARNDSQVWSQHYDRTLSDVLSLQGELAMEIARELQATLTPNEKTTVATKPTQNPEAYLLYLRARERETGVDKGDKDYLAADQLYAQAIALDSTFALAHARRSILNTTLWQSSDGTDAARKSKARAQAEEALRLLPALGEAHLALAMYFYLGEGDPAAALNELAIAENTSPNNGEIFLVRGACYRQQGRWRESIATYQRAQDLDPRNTNIAFLNARNYQLVRDWPAAAKALNHALEIEPNSGYILLFLTAVEWNRGNADAFHIAFTKFPAGFKHMASLIWDQAMIDRDFATAEKTVNEFKNEGEKTYCRAYTALARGDITLAHRLFETFRASYEAGVRDHPEDAEQRSELGLLYAFIGRKEDAIRECRRAVDLVPPSKDPYAAPLMASKLALVYARTGETDEAITLIERLLTTPGAVITSKTLSSYGITLMDLRLRWEWDPLRNNPRFKKIIEGPEPKTIY